MKISFPLITSETNQFDVVQLPEEDDDEFIGAMIGPTLLAFQIRCLNIIAKSIHMGALIDLLQYLPELDSFAVSSLTWMNDRYLSVEEASTFRLLSARQSVKRVQVRHLHDLSELQFILELCRTLQYLQIDDTADIDLECLLRFILMKDVKYIPNLSSICLGTRKLDENFAGRLDRMIHFERLRQDYCIKQIDGKIYLRWS